MKKLLKKLKLPTVLLLLILGIGFLVRLYRITNPVADWHAFRQSDTASVTREYVKHGIDILRPKYQDLSNVQSGIDNLEGWRMVEFPFINAGIAFAIKTMPKLNLILLSRFVSLVFSLGTITSLYYLIKNTSSVKVGLLSSLTFAVLPYSIFYSRTILPEPAMLFFSTFSLLTFYLYLNQKKYRLFNYLLSLLSLSLAFLLKPFVIFLAPVFFILALQRFNKKIIFRFDLLIFIITSVTPFLLWRQWIQQFPSGIPASSWLFNGDSIRLRPAWFRWLLFERLTKLILGYVGVIFFIFFSIPIFNAFIQLIRNITQQIKTNNKLGSLKKTNQKIFKEYSIYIAWWVGMLTYLIIFATGNVRHDYYQTLLTPIICISIAKGFFVLLDLIKRKLNILLSISITSLIYLLMLSLAWKQVKGYFNINHWEYVNTGARADQILPANAKVIAPAFGDTYFLFATNRTGWPMRAEINNKIKNGATHYVTTTFNQEAQELENKYKTLEKTEKYLILDLKQLKP